MRINQYIARALNISRRQADNIIKNGEVTKNSSPVSLNYQVAGEDTILYKDKVLIIKNPNITIMFHKPVGYVCSRNGQGSKTIYDLLPRKYKDLKPVGRLDKNSSGLLLLTNNGNLIQQLSHPSNNKSKRYKVRIDKPLLKEDYLKLTRGIYLKDGLSKFELAPYKDDQNNWDVTLYEGRNRQIRRTFEALQYKVTRLHRTGFADYNLNDLQVSRTIEIN